MGTASYGVGGMITITVPAADRNLLTIAELRAAAGVTGTAQDTSLETLGLEVADSISQACNIAIAGASLPTLRSETIQQMERDVSELSGISLARRPVVSISSVVVDGTTLSNSEYECDLSSGVLCRLVDDNRVLWCASKVVIVYVAGWATVPPDLKAAAKKLVTALWSESTRDPNLKRERSEFGELEYWVPPTSDPLLSAEIQDLLRPYREYSV